MTISESISFSVILCAECGVPFAVTDDFEKRRRNDHHAFHCPNGHANMFGGKSEAQKLRDELQRERQRLDQECARVVDIMAQRDKAEREASAARGQLTRVKNRVRKGVCPDCNRTFADLAEHVRAKHCGSQEAAKLAEERKEGAK